MKASRVLCLLVVPTLVVGLLQPAFATDEPVQTVSSETGSPDEVWVGLASDGQATAVWTESTGIFWATRPLGGGFSAGQKVPGSAGADLLTFHESPNGNAVVAWTSGSSTGALLASVRIGTSGSFGAVQSLAPSTASGVTSLDSSISDSGRAAVVWQQTNEFSENEVRGALSSSSGTFGAAATLATDSVYNPRVDMNDAGAAIAVWDLDVANGTDQVQSASAPAGGSFGQPQVIEDLEQGPGRPDVAVNSGGNAVVVWADFTSDVQGCCSRDVLEARYGNVSGSFGTLQLLTNVQVATATGDHEAAVDNAGRAAILFSAHFNGSYGLFASVSDATGSFPQSQFQTISHAGSSRSGLVRRAFEVAAGGGEFTAFWTNDPDQDGVDEAYHSTTSAGTFGSPHQVSPTSTDQMTRAHGARNSSGEILSGWVQETLYYDAKVAPATKPAPPSGTDGNDDLKGTSGDDVIHLMAGNDVYNAAGGNDSVYGEAGDDKLAGGGGSDLVDGGANNDALVGGAGNDTLRGGGGSDVLQGDASNTVSNVTDARGARYSAALSGVDILLGGRGRDRLLGGPSLDRLNGGAGRDTCFVDSRREKRRAKSCEVIRFRKAN